MNRHSSDPLRRPNPCPDLCSNLFVETALYVLTLTFVLNRM